MNNAWILDVLNDLKRFAVSGNLTETAGQLTIAVDIAELEIREKNSLI